jgi:hypothetical protein
MNLPTFKKISSSNLLMNEWTPWMSFCYLGLTLRYLLCSSLLVGSIIVFIYNIIFLSMGFFFFFFAKFHQFIFWSYNPYKSFFFNLKKSPYFNFWHTCFLGFGVGFFFLPVLLQFHSFLQTFTNLMLNLVSNDC